MYMIVAWERDFLIARAWHSAAEFRITLSWKVSFKSVTSAL